MTYCVALNLADGLVMVSDTRTNAGVDHIATFRKLHQFGIPGERVIFLQTAGNLATSQSVVNLLQHRLGTDLENLYSVPSMFAAATLVSNTVREVLARDNCPPCGGIDLSCSILVSGQIAGEAPQLYNIYPQTNFICATEDTPYLQIGESKYGKFMLELAVHAKVDIETSIKVALSSMISTAHANLSVGPPYDLGVYRNGSLAIEETRFEEDSPFLASLREVWMTHFLDAINQLPSLPTA